MCFRMLQYDGSIWRPPSEARSLILQATVGCSHNACIFCVSYKQKNYRVRGAAGIQSDLDLLPASYKQSVKRVFLADGNALAMSTEDLRDTLSVLKPELPILERVGLYGYAKDVRDKSVDDLRKIKDEGLGIVYLGLKLEMMIYFGGLEKELTQKRISQLAKRYVKQVFLSHSPLSSGWEVLRTQNDMPKQQLSY
jgi:radical SAM superfamily enzyme YgiQ (UPF0313 family)